MGPITPTTERGAAGSLTKASGRATDAPHLVECTTADANRLESFIVGKGVGTLPPRKVGTSPVPGCLTSEDEERETWTAESLRVSLPESFGFSDRDRTKDFGGTRFKGNTIVARDVNRRQHIDFGR